LQVPQIRHFLIYHKSTEGADIKAGFTTLRKLLRSRMNFIHVEKHALYKVKISRWFWKSQGTSQDQKQIWIKIFELLGITRI